MYKNIYTALSCRSYTSTKPEGESLEAYEQPRTEQSVASYEVGVSYAYVDVIVVVNLQRRAMRT